MPSLPPYQPPFSRQLIGTRTGIGGLGVGSTIGHQRSNQHGQHFFPYGASAVQLLLPGWQKTNTLGGYRGESPVPSSVYYLKRIVSITSGGTQYGVGDFLVMPTWGNGFTPAIIMVDAVSAGVITRAHVVRGGVYKTPLADNTAHMAIWQAGFGFGAYNEITYTAGTLTSAGGYISSAGYGGYNYVLANTFLSIAPGPGASGGTLTPQFDLNTLAITAITVGGTWTVSNVTDSNAVVAISSGASIGVLGAGATFVCEWDTAAYCARISIDPIYGTATSSGAGTGFSSHRTVYARKDHPENTGQDVFGNTKDIYVPSGGVVMSDLIPCDIAVGGSAGLRVCIFGDAPTSRYSSLAGEIRTDNFTNFDMSQGGNFGVSFPNTATKSPLWKPLALYGMPKQRGPSCLIFGDSRMMGVTGLADSSGTDTYDIVSGSCGWVERALGNTMPLTNMCRSGETLLAVMRNRNSQYDTLSKMAQMGKFPEFVVTNLGVNDFTASQLASDIAIWEAQLVSDLRGFGAKVIVTDTTSPESTSSATTFTLLWAEIVSGGSGYPASSTFTVTLSGGTFSVQGTISVTTDSAGIVRGINGIPQIGAYTVKPTGTNATTGGGGSGLTVVPHLTNFIDLGTQVTKTGSAQLQLRNTALRAGGYAGYDGFIDWGGGIMESSVGSTLLTPGSTFDGVHPSPGTHIIMGAFAQANLLAWANQAFNMR